MSLNYFNLLPTYYRYGVDTVPYPVAIEEHTVGRYQHTVGVYRSSLHANGYGRYL